MITAIFKSVMRSRGYTEIKPALVKFGFNHDRAEYLANTNLRYVNYNDLEKLCYFLNCTPNDLLAWKPDDKFKPATDHALYALHRTGPAPNLKYYEDKLPAHLLVVCEKVLKEIYENYREETKRK